MIDRTEFKPPAVRLDRVGPAHRTASWSEVPYRRQVWLRGLTPGAAVHVLDDYGNVHETTVRAVLPGKRKGTKEPQVWLYGHPSSYAAGRIFRPGTVPTALAGGAL